MPVFVAKRYKKRSGLIPAFRLQPQAGLVEDRPCTEGSMLKISHTGRSEAAASRPAGPCNPRNCAASAFRRRASFTTTSQPVPTASTHLPCSIILIPAATPASAWAMREAWQSSAPLFSSARPARRPHRCRGAQLPSATTSVWDIREASPTDAPQMAEIDGACVAAGSGGWSRAIFEATMRQPDSTVLVAADGPARAVRRTLNAATSSWLPEPSAGAAVVAAGPMSEVSASNPAVSGITCCSERVQEQELAPHGQLDDALEGVEAAREAAAEGRIAGERRGGLRAASLGAEAAPSTVRAEEEAAAEGRIAGFISGLYVGDELQVENLAVRAEHRGRGVGETLLRNLLERHGICPRGEEDAPFSSCRSRGGSSGSSGGSGTQPLGESEIQLRQQQPDCLLEVKEGNVAAFALYRKLGFRVVGRRRNFYPDGAACLVMRLGGEA